MRLRIYQIFCLRLQWNEWRWIIRSLTRKINSINFNSLEINFNMFPSEFFDRSVNASRLAYLIFFKNPPSFFCFEFELPKWLICLTESMNRIQAWWSPCLMQIRTMQHGVLTPLWRPSEMFFYASLKGLGITMGWKQVRW